MSDELPPAGPVETTDCTGHRVTVEGRMVHDEEAGGLWVILAADGRLATVDRSNRWEDGAPLPVSRFYSSFDEFADAYKANWPMVEAVRARLADDPPTG